MLAILLGFVAPFVIYLKRWRCRSCGVTFTHYPKFLLPYKRYAAPVIMTMSEQYVIEPEATYREVVQPEETPLGYAEKEGGTIDERQLSHTTLWHWLSWLGSKTGLTNQALDLLRQKDPGFELHRLARPMFPGKYRSAKRRNVLERAAELIRIGRRFAELFSKRIFPRLGNRALVASG